MDLFVTNIQLRREGLNNMIGYIAGIINKLVGTLDWVLGLYILNLVMVSADLILVIYYRKMRAAGKLV